METNPVRLMELSHGAGCGCKIGPGDLHGILEEFKSKSKDPRVLVGMDTGDDAAVILVSDDVAIVHTTDFFTPIMNDPYRFGQVAAANAISDVYAMGGEPISALSLVAYPLEKLGKEILRDILKGGYDKAREAGIEVTGGHSIDDAEPKYGLAVIGIVHPKKITTNRGIKEGDYLVLTKPIGVGILTTAIKRNIITPELENLAFQTMSTLNKSGKDAMVENIEYIHSATDITGFGLCGHLYGMLKNTDLSVVLDHSEIPMLDGIDSYLAQKCYPGGTNRNWRYVEAIVDMDSLVNEKRESLRLKICDPQTSGGLLIAVAPEGKDKLIESLKKHKTLAHSVIGQIIKKGDNSKQILVR